MDQEEKQEEDKEEEQEEEQDKDKEQEPKTNKPCFVYLLEATNKSTYVGATVDLNKRLRQHNKEIKGGAVATSKKVIKGEQWTRICHVAGFPTWSAALQFEWRWKHLSRQLPAKMLPLDRRMKALTQLLALDRPTSKSVPYSEWPAPPQVIMESIHF